MTSITNTMSANIDVKRQSEGISDITQHLNHDEYLEHVKQMILRTHKHSDNSKVELRLLHDARAAEQELIFANEQQAMQRSSIIEQQKALFQEENRRQTQRSHPRQRTTSYDSKEKLIHNSKIIFTCNCGKSFAFGTGGHDEHLTKDLMGIQSYDDTKEGKFSKLNEYGLLVDAPSPNDIVRSDYAGELPKANFSTGYDKNTDSPTTPY